VESIDYYPFEGATKVYNLNSYICRDFENRYDFIVDGGTIEHIFNIPKFWIIC
jgi:hypothetical protein